MFGTIRLSRNQNYIKQKLKLYKTYSNLYNLPIQFNQANYRKLISLIYNGKRSNNRNFNKVYPIPRRSSLA